MSTIEIFNGIRIADEESMTNFRLSLRGAALGLSGIIPMTLVAGCPRAGKTSLMEMMLRVRFGEARWTMNPKGSRGWARTMNRASSEEYVAFDNLPSVESIILHQFLTSNTWVFRRRSELVQKPLHCQVFATVPDWIKLSRDTLRRVRIIRLAPVPPYDSL